MRIRNQHTKVIAIMMAEHRLQAFKFGLAVGELHHATPDAEAALRVSEELVRTLSNSAPGLIEYKDVHGKNFFSSGPL